MMMNAANSLRRRVRPSPPMRAFWPWPVVIQLSAYALTHPRLDMQVWFETQVSRRAAHLTRKVRD